MRMVAYSLLCPLLIGALLAGACGDDSSSASLPDLAVAHDMSAATDMPEGDAMTAACVSNPMTHVEIINACTTAQSYDKMPFYPGLAPGGMLPPLP